MFYHRPHPSQFFLEYRACGAFCAGLTRSPHAALYVPLFFPVTSSTLPSFVCPLVPESFNTCETTSPSRSHPGKSSHPHPYLSFPLFWFSPCRCVLSRTFDHPFYTHNILSMHHLPCPPLSTPRPPLPTLLHGRSVLVCSLVHPSRAFTPFVRLFALPAVQDMGTVNSLFICGLFLFPKRSTELGFRSPHVPSPGLFLF